VMRLNTDQRGLHLGAFKEDDKILTLTRSGFYKLMSFDLSNHFEEDMVLIEKFNPSKALTVIYYSDPKKAYFVKRFIPEFSDKKVSMFPEEEGNKFVAAVADKRPQIKVEYDNKDARKPIDPEEIILDEFVEVMGLKAKGKKLSNHPVSLITWLDPIPVEEEEEAEPEEESNQDDESEIPDESETSEDSETIDESETLEESIESAEKEEIAEIIEVKVEKKEKAEKKVKAEKIEKIEKIEKTEKLEKSEKSEKSDKTEKVKKDTKPEIKLPPPEPPDFPEDDDDAGRGIQMTLF